MNMPGGRGILVPVSRYLPTPGMPPVISRVAEPPKIRMKRLIIKSVGGTA